MRLNKGLLVGCVAAALMALWPHAADAQSGIAGVVKDTTGAVLPGVTVEAASPALIEKVRTVVTDESGQYKIVDLRPGTYVVTFTLPGFGVFVRDGIELPANFTATINADLKVGSIEETVTVSGLSPVVDLQNAAQQQILPRAVIDAVPSGKSVWSIGSLVPGVSLSGQDVGGSRGMQQLTLTVHGSQGVDTTVQVDGLKTNSFQDNVQTYYNDQMFEEMTYQTSAMSAEVGGAGVRTNMIPKEGGNTFKGTLYFGLEPGSWVGENSTPELVALGLQAPGRMKINRDLSGGLGGPIKRDKLWFFFSARRWGVDQYVNNSFYNLDPTHRTYSPDFSRQVVDDNMIKSAVLRLTYRAGPHKLAAYEDRIVKFRGHECGSNVLEENCGVRWPRIYYTAQVKYTGTLTSRLLVESGLSINNESFSTGDPQPTVKPGDISRSEITGIPGGAPAAAVWGAPAVRNNRFPEVAEVLSSSLAYVTGSHAYKTGVTIGRGHEVITANVGEPAVNDLTQRYRVGVSDSVNVYNTPVISENNSSYDLAVYAQDTWTMKRLTLSPGLRLEFFDSYYPAKTVPAGRFIAARTVVAEPQSERPHWKDLAPRFGAVYDLFGDTRTAVKASWGRYVRTYNAGFSSIYNPMATTSDTRTWKDWNGDDVAQGDLRCDIAKTWSTATVNVPGCEIGPPTKDIGSKVNQTHAPGIKRPANTETSLGIQHQVVPGMSLSFAYTHRNYTGNFFTQNLATTPLGAPLTSGYTLVYVPNPCATPNAQCDSHVNGAEMLPVYNLAPALLGLTDLYDQNSPNYERKFNAYDIGFQARIFGGTAFGGASWGQEVEVNCDVQNPNSFRYCDEREIGRPYRAQYKMSGTYPLPYGVTVSGSFRSEPGAATTESYSISKAIFASATGQTLTATSQTVQLLPTGTVFLPRINTLDLRFAKRVQLGRYRLQGQLDVFNSLNANPVTGRTTAYGATFGRVSSILTARIFQAGGTFSF